MRVVRFRPCIDLHAGRVKQIVGGTLADGAGASAPETNFETDMASSYFASLYARDELPGGHVIMLGPGNESAAEDALAAFPGGMHVGGGVNPLNSARYLNAGASHVIVTSYVFRDGEVDLDRVEEMTRAVGRSRLVLDVSCETATMQRVCAIAGVRMIGLSAPTAGRSGQTWSWGPRQLADSAIAAMNF
jgi:phosphoribosylformimino-5-aminoimidazole carboxamide ribotide isomerase